MMTILTRAAKLVTVTTASVGLLACSLGTVGGPEPTSCELAAQHLTSCLGSSLEIQIDDVCDASAAALSEQVLQQPCSALVGDRSTMGFKDMLCMVLPFICNTNNPGNPGNPGQPVVQPHQFRIADCWNNPQWGFCYDVVKINAGSGCTALMEPAEWQRPGYTHYECTQPDGMRCRLARVCQQFSDKAQCVSSVQHHTDLPRCQAWHPGQPQPGPGGCTSDGECGNGSACYFNHTCIPLNSRPAGASCQAADGSYRGNLCQPGLGCKINFSGGQAHSKCGTTFQP